MRPVEFTSELRTYFTVNGSPLYDYLLSDLPLIIGMVDYNTWEVKEVDAKAFLEALHKQTGAEYYISDFSTEVDPERKSPPKLTLVLKMRYAKEKHECPIVFEPTGWRRDRWIVV